MKPSYGVIVGRFQVNDLHDGHMELFRQVSARHSGVIVFVGVHPAGLSKNHPLDFPTRKAMIQAKFPSFTVLPLADTRDDSSWSASLDTAIASAITGPADIVLYGGRDSFVPHYNGKHAPVELALPVEAQGVSGTMVRDEFANKVIESPEFRAGLIYAAAHQYPVVNPTVDVAIFDTTYSEVLLGRKPSDPKGKWRFIGGFAEKTRPAYEDDVRVEAYEEANLDIGEIEFIGSAVIPDWRFVVPDKSIKTAFFAATTMSMGAKAGDDIEEVHWFKSDKLEPHDIVDTHQVLYSLFRQFLETVATRKRVNATIARISEKLDKQQAAVTSLSEKLADPVKIFSPEERPESAGNALRQAVRNEENETGALRLKGEKHAGTAKA
jgi:bifunctional NMN adenylyltransferase/nudix hydrolase